VALDDSFLFSTALERMLVGDIDVTAPGAVKAVLMRDDPATNLEPEPEADQVYLLGLVPASPEVTLTNVTVLNGGHIAADDVTFPKVASSYGTALGVLTFLPRSEITTRTVLAVSGTGRASSAEHIVDLDGFGFLGGLDIAAHVTLADWTPSVPNTIVSTFGTTGFRFRVTSTGALGLALGGTTDNLSPPTGFADGAQAWIRARWQISPEAGIRFSVSLDAGETPIQDVEWMPLGTLIATGGEGSISSPSGPYVGSDTAGASNVNGQIERVVIRTAVDPPTEPWTFIDVDFTTLPPGATSFTQHDRDWTVTPPASVVATATEQAAWPLTWVRHRADSQLISVVPNGSDVRLIWNHRGIGSI
jgi:hypothetical protein